MRIFGKQKIQSSEFGQALGLLLFTWWKDQGKTIFNSAIEKANVKASERKAAEEALVLGMFAVTWGCENHIGDPAQLTPVLDAFHRTVYGYLLEEGHIASRKVAPNITFDASVVAGEFEASLVRPRYAAYQNALGDTNPVMALGRVAARALGGSQEDAIEDLRFANVVSAVLQVMKETIDNLEKEYRIVLYCRFLVSGPRFSAAEKDPTKRSGFSR